MVSERSEANHNWYVYILECKNNDLYTGITNNLERRIKEHKRGKGGKFTKSFKVKKLLYSELFSTKSQALRREAQIKGWTRKKKLALIKGDVKLLRQL
jgi:putative endonuclease